MKFLKRWEVWATIFVTMVAIVVGIVKAKDFPKQIEEVKEEVKEAVEDMEENKDNIQKVAGTMNEFMVEQRTHRKNLVEQRALMIKYIDAKAEKDGE